MKDYFFYTALLLSLTSATLGAFYPNGSKKLEIVTGIAALLCVALYATTGRY